MDSQGLLPGDLRSNGMSRAQVARLEQRRRDEVAARRVSARRLPDLRTSRSLPLGSQYQQRGRWTKALEKLPFNYVRNACYLAFSILVYFRLG